MFTPVKSWDQLKPGDVVWEIGMHNMEPRFYGPFEVVDAKKRVLRNSEHREWIQYDIGHFVHWRCSCHTDIPYTTTRCVL